MRKHINFAVCLIVSLLISCFSVYAEVQYKDLGNKSNIDRTKQWTIKFNRSIKPDTVNTSNIVVKDEGNNPIGISVALKNSQEIIVNTTFGFKPDKAYYIYISGVKDVSGNTIKTPVKMKFHVVGDRTTPNQLATVDSVNFKTPLLSTEYQEFILTNKSGQDLKYRIFAYEYKNYRYSLPIELTSGYTTPLDNKITSVKKLPAGGNKYKFVVYVKRNGTTGVNIDNLTDYDHYYVDYFRVVDKIESFQNTENEYFNKVDYTNAINELIKNQPEAKNDEGFSKVVFASTNEMKFYLNPNNFKDSYSKYMFMSLKYFEGVTATALDSVLNGKGVLSGKGQVFLDAGKANNVNPIYLVCHVLLETGNGTSALSNGILVSQVNGAAVTPKKAYNMYGIQAIDGDPNKCGSEYAYKSGWFTVDDAIKGGAAWISPRYINASSGPQDTLYKMKWNVNSPSSPWHQYATDIGWAYKQISRYKTIMDQIPSLKLKYEIPLKN